MTKTQNKQLGHYGEEITEQYFQQQGYKILQKNFSCKLGDMDLIAEKSNRICFIEVKTRSQSKFGTPAQAVGTAKQQKLRRIAQWYLKSKGWMEKPITFHVASVMVEGDQATIDVIENAF